MRCLTHALDSEADIFVQKKRLKGARAREAAEYTAMDVDSSEAENSSMPEGRIVEVVLPRLNATIKKKYVTSVESSEEDDATAPPSSDAPSGAESSEGEGAARPRKGTAQAAINIDSDSDSDMASRKKLVGKGKVSKGPLKIKAAKRKAIDSDYEESDAETELDEEDGNVDEDENIVSGGSESEGQKKPAKKSTKSARPAKRAKTNKAGDASKSKKAAKPKKEAKPQKLREATDPWKLKSTARKDWKQMHSPPLEMFHFARVVIDEYTYLDGKILSMVQKLTAARRWVLSGTPPVHDFGSLKTISAFLDLHLGVDDDGEGQSALIKKRKREQTGSFLQTALPPCILTILARHGEVSFFP